MKKYSEENVVATSHLLVPKLHWERDCLRNSVASAAAIFRVRSAMELLQQVRSQMEFGNEGRKRFSFLSPIPLIPKIP